MLKISRDERGVALRPRNRLPRSVRGTLLRLFAAVCIVDLSLHQGSKGNNINSRKKHEQEVMRLTQEHNRLDQRNLVSCPRFYLQTAGTRCGR